MLEPNIKSKYVKTQVDGAGGPIIYINLIIKKFEYALKSAGRAMSSVVFHINRSGQKYYLATNVLGDSYGPPAEIN